MQWVIFMVIILIALILLFLMKGREVTYSGSRTVIYYTVIALMVVLLIISIVAWYTATIPASRPQNPQPATYNYKT